jgi:hypothetical protein
MLQLQNQRKKSSINHIALSSDLSQLMMSMIVVFLRQEPHFRPSMSTFPTPVLQIAVAVPFLMWVRQIEATSRSRDRVSQLWQSLMTDFKQKIQAKPLIRK